MMTGQRQVGVWMRMGVVAAIGAALSGVGQAQMAPPGTQMAMAMSKTPAVGEKAPDFTLPMLDGTKVRLAAELAHGPVVLILLRGFPEYQCPYCTRQFGEFLKQAKDIEALGARVVWVYPSFDQDASHARAFVAGMTVPTSFRLALDSDYAFTLKYGLRWDAPKETTYPSTFVVDRKGIVRFAQVSRSHAGRTPVADVLKALAELPK